jgi:hypothetical protein
MQKGRELKRVVLARAVRWHLEHRILRYRRAVSRIGKPGLVRHSISPEARLSEHLMIYYWWGQLDFGGDELLESFYALAPSDLRAHAMWSVRQFLAQADAPPAAFERLRKLIERRLAAAIQSRSADEFLPELEMFGYWFVEGHFEEQWALTTLLSTLRLTKKTHDESNVVKRLAELCPRYPTECVECLRLMIEGDRERWVVVSVEANARDVLRLALESNVLQAALAARRLVQDLIMLGYYEFRTLLH